MLQGLLVWCLIPFAIPLFDLLYTHDLSFTYICMPQTRLQRDSLNGTCCQNPNKTACHSPMDISFQPSLYSNHSTTTFIQPLQRLPKNPHNNLCLTSSPQPLQTLYPPHHKRFNCSKCFNLLTTNVSTFSPAFYSPHHGRGKAPRP